MIGFLIGGEEKVFNPANIAVLTNAFVAIPERVRRASLFFFGHGRGEELDSFRFKLGDEVSRDPMVNNLEETEFPASFDQEVFGVRFGEVNEWDRRVLEGAGCVGVGVGVWFCGFENTELFNWWFGQSHHC